jgi:hypothetical protein
MPWIKSTADDQVHESPDDTGHLFSARVNKCSQCLQAKRHSCLGGVSRGCSGYLCQDNLGTWKPRRQRPTIRALEVASRSPEVYSLNLVSAIDMDRHVTEKHGTPHFLLTYGGQCGGARIIIHIIHWFVTPDVAAGALHR